MTATTYVKEDEGCTNRVACNGGRAVRHEQGRIVQGGRLFPRRFALVRNVDYTGVSGVAVVAYGVKFSDGQVVVRWLSEHPGTSMWSSMDDMIAAHSREPTADVQWIDQPADALDELAGKTDGGRRRSRRTNRQAELPPTNGTSQPALPPGPRPAAGSETQPETSTSNTNGQAGSAGLLASTRPPSRSSPAGEGRSQAGEGRSPAAGAASRQRIGRHSGQIETDAPSPAERQKPDSGTGRPRGPGRHRRDISDTGESDADSRADDLT